MTEIIGYQVILRPGGNHHSGLSNRKKRKDSNLPNSQHVGRYQGTLKMEVCECRET